MAAIKPTEKQKNLAKARLENPLIGKKKLVALGGYGKSIQKTPSKALESKGYLEEIRRLGLTEEFITTALVSDIENKPKNRLGELRLGSDILKMTEKKDDNKTQVNILVLSEGLAKKYAITPNTKPDSNG